MADNNDRADGGAGSGGTVPILIQEEMQRSYLDYAMSVIVGRAIPDARDGLKPVHRRILYAMNEMRLFAAQPYKKCARVVGEVLGKYHPHGDKSVYDALVRMAQDFAMRMMLVDGQGNFGSVDGDPPAAMRYTEARLAKIAGELLEDIDKETVDFGDNFDASEREPLVLPARYPNLLVNGAGGIAVGMATNIPPHNLGEVVDATIMMIDNPHATLDELMTVMHGPDFPTGGLIYGKHGIRQAFATGRGNLIMRARCAIEPMPRGDREQIVVTEIPYQVNKATMLQKMAELVREKRLEGISDLRDESSREGMRVVIELKRDANSGVVLNQLYKNTQLQESFGVINLSIVAGQPRVLSLAEMLRVFIDHRRDVVTRRTRFELRAAEAQREVVLGLGMATTDIDRVIMTIRESPDVETARERLMALPLHGLEEFVRRAGRPDDEIAAAAGQPEYRLTERQAKAILDMRLARLTGLEREKLAVEYGELSNTIARLQSILGDERVLMSVIRGELIDVRARYADPRRTEIVADEGEISIEDLIAEQQMVVTCSHKGFIKRTALSDYRAQRRGGRGKIGMEARDDDFINRFFVASTHDHVLFFTDRGRVFLKKVYEIAEGSRTSKGRSIVNFVGIDTSEKEGNEREKIAAVVPVSEFREGADLVTATAKGLVKRTTLSAYSNIRQTGIIGVAIEEGDTLLRAVVTDPGQEIMLGTRAGMSIRFKVDDIRQVGRDSRGVRGIELRDGDTVVSMDVIADPAQQQVLTVCANGYGKRTLVEEHRCQSRGGVGIIAIDASERNGDVVDLDLVTEAMELMVITDRGQIIRTKVSEVRQAGRNTQGVRIIRLDSDEKVVAVEPVAEPESDSGSSESLVPPAPAEQGAEEATPE
jgi:DNA gyrase subunit A